jgi:hypothetical protein
MHGRAVAVNFVTALGDDTWSDVMVASAINSVGNLGGFVAQNIVPWIRDQTGSKTDGSGPSVSPSEVS